MKTRKKNKESTAKNANKKRDGRQPIQAVHVQEASEAEADQIELAMKRLLLELTTQERARRSKSS